MGKKFIWQTSWLEAQTQKPKPKASNNVTALANPPPLPPVLPPLLAAAVVVVLDVAQTPLTLCSRPDRPEIYEFGYPVASDLALPVATACSE